MMRVSIPDKRIFKVYALL